MSATKASDRLANVVAMPFVPTHKAATLVHASLVTPEIPTSIVTTSMNVRTIIASVAEKRNVKTCLVPSNAHVSTRHRLTRPINDVAALQ